MTETFCWKHFDALTNTELYALLKLRSEIFVVEQNCVFLDLDDHDQNALHLLMHDATGQLIGYTRLLPPGEKYIEPSIGRVVVSSAVRSTGAGRRLMAESVRGAREHYPALPNLIWAQAHLERFYSSFGFVTETEPELEDGIPHVKMRLPA
ncbi:MAG: GNAT family N-acetyltransferase [Stagnimonas sp.]|nr:GNAT family N-acetyltransferase [Stagnimonas sp.]